TMQAGVRSTFLRGENDNRQRGLYAESNMFAQESLMLTGDLNVAEVEWIVQYKIKDPVLFAFKVRNAQETLRNMSEAIMQLVIGDNSINEVLTVGREKISHQVAEKLQQVMDSYETGMLITNVVLQDVTPPDPVRPSFNEVNEAKQEKEKAINQAWEDYNRTIPAARGQADKVIREAEGYALDRVNRARGDAEKFTEIWNAYKDSKEVTRKRLYLETMQKVWPEMSEKFILDEDVKGLLPLLDLSEKKGGPARETA
ncbi:MAG: FtsH protease activity modulator HflK, partial [Candidatus Omnitrophica bacterium]|nr:FtsH protease activity modulator HflK [Candidatus Omnitrophota bacterium]